VCQKLTLFSWYDVHISIRYGDSDFDTNEYFFTVQKPLSGGSRAAPTRPHLNSQLKYDFMPQGFTGDPCLFAKVGRRMMKTTIPVYKGVFLFGYFGLKL
jgi:hypothetical protein